MSILIRLAPLLCTIFAICWYCTKSFRETPQTLIDVHDPLLQLSGFSQFNQEEISTCLSFSWRTFSGTFFFVLFSQAIDVHIFPVIFFVNFFQSKNCSYLVVGLRLKRQAIIMLPFVSRLLDFFTKPHRDSLFLLVVLFCSVVKLIITQVGIGIYATSRIVCDTGHFDLSDRINAECPLSAKFVNGPYEEVYKFNQWTYFVMVTSIFPILVRLLVHKSDNAVMSLITYLKQKDGYVSAGLCVVREWGNVTQCYRAPSNSRNISVSPFFLKKKSSIYFSVSTRQFIT